METNKTLNEELRSQKSTSILIGYVLALAAMFVAFEYTQREIKIVETEKIYDFKMEEDMIPITQQQEIVAPPPAAAPTEVVTNKVFDVVEQMPSFPGGPAALMKYLSENMRYPAVAEESGIQGRVTVQFVVEKDGSVTDVRTMKSVDPALDREAERVVKSMPKWIPGKQNGSAVRVKYFVPVVFRLQ